jgi:hypothetical protein
MMTKFILLFLLFSDLLAQEIISGLSNSGGVEENDKIRNKFAHTSSGWENRRFSSIKSISTGIFSFL